MKKNIVMNIKHFINIKCFFRQRRVLFLCILIVYVGILNASSKKAVNNNRFFKMSSYKPNNEFVSTNPYILLEAAKDAYRFFRSRYKKNIIKTKTPFSNDLISSKDAEKTLKFIIRTIEHERKWKKFRMLNTKFLRDNFKFIRWFADVKSAKENNMKIPRGYKESIFKRDRQIRLTKYAAFRLIGSNHKNKWYRYPLYAIQDKRFERVERLKFSKHQILSGILNRSEYKNKVKPIVWLTRHGLEEALMQGSAIVKLPGGKIKIFNVDKNNGIPYDKKIRNRKKQKRYWYFKEVKKGQSVYDKHLSIIKRGGVACAGNVYDIGLGKIMALRYKNKITKKLEIKLVVLLDSGGALNNNFYQLDFFAGIFDNKKQFKKSMRALPEFVESYLLVKK